MKLQDLHPIDSTTLGLDNVYHTIGEQSHYINSECIQTPKKIITKGNDYLIASTIPQRSDAIVHKYDYGMLIITKVLYICLL